MTCISFLNIMITLVLLISHLLNIRTSVTNTCATKTFNMTCPAAGGFLQTRGACTFLLQLNAIHEVYKAKKEVAVFCSTNVGEGWNLTEVCINTTKNGKRPITCNSLLI